MNYNKLLKEYLDKIPEEEPIFINEIKDYFKTIEKQNYDKIIKNIYVYINRLVKQDKLILFSKGIYYKPKKGKFGLRKINIAKVIEKKYIKEKEKIKGYISGAYLFNKIGLTTQVPNDLLIITNECPNKNEYKNKALGVRIKKPKIEINRENYIYLQLLDLLANDDDINIEVENEKEKIYNFIKENELEFENIFKYAKATKNKKAIKRLYDLE